ncbi:hypothetical protein NC652_033309 [Populus alba x Populus x berolinensis]|nr:hypothetical protein NC652_033309 [Populus alba x Populus x berolinensis]
MWITEVQENSHSTRKQLGTSKLVVRAKYPPDSDLQIGPRPCEMMLPKRIEELKVLRR